jgi:hypothetical protein
MLSRSCLGVDERVFQERGAHRRQQPPGKAPERVHVEISPISRMHGISEGESQPVRRYPGKFVERAAIDKALLE